jgi:hypothetical protein
MRLEEGTRASEGTYQSHYLTTADKTIPASDAIPDQLLGAIWMPYLAGRGCLIWKQQLQPGKLSYYQQPVVV